MKRLLDHLLGGSTCRDDGSGVCRDTTEAERRHDRAMKEGEWTLRRAERTIREAIREIRAAHDSWEQLYGRDEGGGR